jgi:hypothetical protein
MRSKSRRSANLTFLREKRIFSGKKSMQVFTGTRLRFPKRLEAKRKALSIVYPALTFKAVRVKPFSPLINDGRAVVYFSE